MGEKFRVCWLKTLLDIGAAPWGCPFRRSVASGAPIGLAVLLVLLLPLPTWPQTVDELLSDPVAFDRQGVTVSGQVTTLIIEEGEKPYTKFKLGDTDKTIPVFMRGVQALTEGESYEVDGVFLVKPSSDGSEQISGIVGQTVLPLEEGPLEEEPLEEEPLEEGPLEVAQEETEETAEEPASKALSDDQTESEVTALDAASDLLVGELLDDPVVFDRQAVSVAGEITTLIIEDGDHPSTKFKLQDASGEIPVFMRGVRLLTEGESYEVDGVFLVKPTNDGAGEVSGIVAMTVEPVEPFEPVGSETASALAEAPTDKKAAPPVYKAQAYAVRDLLADQSNFDRRFVSVTGQVTTLTTRYGDRTYQKFKLTDQSGTIPVFIPGTSSCEQGQICKVTGVFLIKRTQSGESEISGIKADAVEKVEDAPYREWTSVVFQDRSNRTGSNGRTPKGFMFPE